jgi:hypothetical protein
MRRTSGPARSTLREQLAARLRASAADYALRIFDTAEEVERYLTSCPEVDLAAQLDTGQPVEVSGWRLRGLMAHSSPTRRCLLDADGTVTPTA